MLLKYFLMYLGVFLALSITLFAIAGKFSEGIAAGGKKPAVYGSFSAIIASVAAYGITLVSEHLFAIYWFLSGLYLLFGIIHLLFVHKKYFGSQEYNSSDVILGEIFFGLSVIFFSIVVFSALKYFIKESGKNVDYLFYPMLISTISFFIPFLFMHMFEAACSIPAADYKTWQYPADPIDLPDENPREKILIMGFEIAKKSTDKSKTFFRARGPEGMLLGDLYYHFMNDYNDDQSETPIEYSVNNHEAYTWWFRLKTKWYQFSKILNPEVSMRENGIKENSVIICERIEKR
jgi:hypothetical protein